MKYAPLQRLSKDTYSLGSKHGLQPLDPPQQPSQEASLEKAVQRAGSIAGIKKLHQCKDSNYYQVIWSSGEQPRLLVIFSCCYGREHASVHLQKGMVVDFSWGKGEMLREN